MKHNRKMIDDEILQAYYQRIRGIPLLSFEKELELSRRIQDGDDAARQQMIEANLRLVIKIAKGYLSSKLSLMDLIQEGNMGLMQAVDKYDYQKEVRFATYAAWWIRQAISRYLSNKHRTIRIPHRKEELLRKIQRANYSLNQIHMRQPKIEEIAQEINVSKDDVRAMLSYSYDVLSYDGAEGRNDPRPLMESYGDYTYSPERELLRKSSRDATLRVLNNLKERERRILMYRYQLKGAKYHTLRGISSKMGLSTETVRQIELKALKKLRGEAEDLRVLMEAR
ncbi:MAG: RNA polymerase sigma factor RpoD/SigA [Treponema sp.]|nr:RNA polymerase sigma factor RpoD/SigA [Treponema sp.]